MNEGAKTGMYWVVAAVMLVVATFVSWPQKFDSDVESLVGQPLFPNFTDPLAASSLRIVKFDEDQGALRRFEVAKDEATGVWSLPSRNNYPADAAEQMQAAANSLVGVKVLDVQTENAEDHASLGVIEPKADSLEVGDEGVGLLVTFRGDKNTSLASLIVGNPVAGSTDKRYVRVPGENPVYVVNLDSSVFSTRFADWIEKDLLQLSSIEIARVDLQSYDSALESAGSLAMNRSYNASVEVDGTSDWKLLSLVKFDQQQEAQTVTLAEGEKLATAKLNELKNALDDLTIVDVASKPKGMSDNLKADKDLVSDNEAVKSLAVRGFFPINTGEILSANGEMSVTLNDGVQYILRFGNVEGMSEEADAEGKSVSSANRYLLVTAQVDESKFPPPALKPIPKTIEELDAMNQPETVEAPAEPDAPAEPAPADSPAKPVEDAAADDKPVDPAAEQPKSGSPVEPADEKSDGAAEPAEAATQSSEDTADACSDDEPTSDDPAAAESTKDTDPQPVDKDSPAADAPAEAAPAAEKVADEKPAAPPAAEPAPTEPKDQETAEEKQERLEAEQEKITKENQRLLDERKDRIEAARRRVRELNNRFAQWYYVIPESTYTKLKIPYDGLIEKPSADAAAPPAFDPAGAAPGFQLPGLNQ